MEKKMNNYLLYAGWAFVTGAMVPAMMIFNAHLAKSVGSAQLAFPIPLFVGFLTAMVFYAVTRPPLPTWETMTTISPHCYFGGFMVAFYMLSVTYLAPRFGVGNTVMFIVLAQLCVSTAVDTWGLFGATVRQLSPMRMIGLLVIVAGVVTTQLAAVQAQRQ
jgi:transporter family-2 protein